MEVIVSAAVSSDGCMDDASPRRLVLSNTQDWEEVHRLRAACDAILVGAETVRRDNPSLVVRDPELRRWRVGHGMKADIAKIVITGSGRLDPSVRFFTEGAGAEKFVIASQEADEERLRRLSGKANIIVLPKITARAVIDRLSGLGISSLIVEGGAETIRMFLEADAIDRFRLAISPVLVNDPAAVQLPYFDRLPFEGSYAVKSVRRVGDMTVYDYGLRSAAGLLSGQDLCRLQRAVAISERSVPCDTAYRVGCVVVTADGREYEGYTHETEPHSHAEEEAVGKALSDGACLRGASVYVSMEPCSTRSSKPVSCSELLIKYGVGRVVYAYAEPDCFVCCEGSRLLQEAGVEVIAVPELSGRVIELNSHILNRMLRKEKDN